MPQPPTVKLSIAPAKPSETAHWTAMGLGPQTPSSTVPAQSPNTAFVPRPVPLPAPRAAPLIPTTPLATSIARPTPLGSSPAQLQNPAGSAAAAVVARPPDLPAKTATGAPRSRLRRGLGLGHFQIRWRHRDPALPQGRVSFSRQDSTSSRRLTRLLHRSECQYGDRAISGRPVLARIKREQC
jgi:hypothetical protein